MKRMWFLLGFCLCMFCFCSTVNAAETTRSFFYAANPLAQKCRELINGDEHPDMSVTAAQGVCLGYIDGVLDTLVLSKGFWSASDVICVPEGVTSDQAVRVFVKYADEHPEKLHLNAPDIILDSLEKAFPCHK